MAYPYTPYPTSYYQPYQPPMPDQLAQLRQNQMQQPMTQPMMQTPAQPMQQVGQPPNPVLNQQNGIIWVGSKIEADNYLVAPNSAVALWDMNNPVVYLRQADSTGKPTTKVYDLVERTTASASPCTPQVKYVTLDKFQELEDRLAALENKPCKCADKKRVKEEPENG